VTRKHQLPIIPRRKVVQRFKVVQIRLNPIKLTMLMSVVRRNPLGARRIPHGGTVTLSIASRVYCGRD